MAVHFNIIENLILFFSYPSLGRIGVAAGLYVLYLTRDWIGADVLKLVPIYNKRYGENVGDPPMQ